MPSLRSRLEKLEAQRPDNQERPFLRFWQANTRADHVDEDLADACQEAGITLGDDDFVMVLACGLDDDFAPTITSTGSRKPKDGEAERGFVPPNRVNRIVITPLRPLQAVQSEGQSCQH